MTIISWGILSNGNLLSSLLQGREYNNFQVQSPSNVALLMCGCALRLIIEYESPCQLLSGGDNNQLQVSINFKSGDPDEWICPCQLRPENSKQERRYMLLERPPQSNVQLSQILLSYEGWDSMTLWLTTKADVSEPQRPRDSDSVFRGDFSKLFVNN